MKKPTEDTVSAVMAELGRRRFASMSKQEQSELGRLGGRNSWANMTARERRIEQLRRQKLSRKRKAKQILAKLSLASR